MNYEIGQHLNLLKQQYREQIEQAQTVEELNAIELHFDMLDFTQTMSIKE